MELTKEERLLISHALLIFKDIFDEKDIDYLIKAGVLEKRSEYRLSEYDLVDGIQNLRGKL